MSRKNEIPAPSEMSGNEFNNDTTTCHDVIIGTGEVHKYRHQQQQQENADKFYDPFEHREKKNLNSDLGSLAHLIKMSFGSGILAMPNAIRNGGLIFGGIGTIIIGMICAHTVHILVKSSQVLCRRMRRPMMTYAETAEAVLLCGPLSLRKFSNTFKTLVNTGLSATYVGSCCVHVVFIAESIKQVTDYHTGMDMDKRFYMIALIPAVVFLAQIRNLKYLVPFSMLANVSLMTGLALTLYYLFQNTQPMTSIKLFSSVRQLPIFFSTVIFAIEGIGAVMPVENRMEKPQHFLGCPSVLSIAMTILIFIYPTIGVLGYLRYGENTASLITLNLDASDPLAQVVKLLIALAILFTYGLQLFVPLEIMCSFARPKFGNRYATIGEILLRLFVALFTVTVAVAVPFLEPFIALVGAIFLSTLGILVPAIIETISCWEAHLGMFKWRLWKNSFLVVFATLALVTGTLVSLNGIIEIYANE